MDKSLGKEKHTLLTCAILFVVYFAMLFMYINIAEFRPDECDNILGGIMAAAGYSIYGDFVAHHMPLMYYLCAFFKTIGASTVPSFRILFYATLSLIWIGMYYRYNKHFGKLTMALYPVAYIVIQYSVSHVAPCILSEGLQTQGLVILFIEFLLFVKDRTVNIGNGIAISFAILISFGSAFISIFPITIIALGVITLEIIDAIGQKHNMDAFITSIIKKYWKLVLFIIAPFFVLVVYYWASGNLSDAYYGAYVFNRDIYSQYTGYGQDIFNTLWGSIARFCGWILNFSSSALNLFGLVILASFLTYLLKKKYYIPSVIVLAYLIFCGGREYYEFHSLPFWGVILFMLCVLIGKITNSIIAKQEKKEIAGCKLAYISVLCVMFGVVSIPYLSHVHNDFPNVSDITPQYPLGSYEYIIDELADENEKILDTTLNDFYVFTNTLPATAVLVACPWLYEAYEQRIFNDLESYKPNIVIFDYNQNVWGYMMRDFAPTLVDFILSNYVQLDPINYPALYVCNERHGYYNNALMQLIMENVFCTLNAEDINEAEGVSSNIDDCEMGQHLLLVRGWSYMENVDAATCEVYLEFCDAEGKITFFKTNKESRPDVGAYFSNSLYNESGFRVLIPKNMLAEGENTISVILDKQHKGTSTYKYEV